nr:PREDICTED: probable palmitoyltransferase ZDHHC16 [Bemisia tabaci]
MVVPELFSTALHLCQYLWLKWKDRWSYLKLCILSLFHNKHLDVHYFLDVLLGPMYWFVDNFTKRLGPAFVTAVCCLMAAVIVIAHWIGLPYWWEKSPFAAVLLVIFGYWLLVNTLFHYYMGVTVNPGTPPEGGLIQEAVSICKKCIAPKPPRTHHCSVCNRCILKMDHHCPWLNNCVGHHNHRYFFSYMIFITLGTFYLMLFGFEIAYHELWEDYFRSEDLNDESLEGHAVRINKSLPVDEWVLEPVNGGDIIYPVNHGRDWRRKAILFMAFICSGAFVAIGALLIYHYRLISAGETSIEYHINKDQRKKFAALNKEYKNPYNFGRKRNWRIFFGLQKDRSWLHVFFPSAHKPIGDGLQWQTIYSGNPLEVHAKTP